MYIQLQAVGLPLIPIVLSFQTQSILQARPLKLRGERTGWVGLRRYLRDEVGGRRRCRVRVVGGRCVGIFFGSMVVHERLVFVDVFLSYKRDVSIRRVQ